MVGIMECKWQGQCERVGEIQLRLKEGGDKVGGSDEEVLETGWIAGLCVRLCDAITRQEETMKWCLTLAGLQAYAYAYVIGITKQKEMMKWCLTLAGLQAYAYAYVMG